MYAHNLTTLFATCLVLAACGQNAEVHGMPGMSALFKDDK